MFSIWSRLSQNNSQIFINKIQKGTFGFDYDETARKMYLHKFQNIINWFQLLH